MNRMLHRMVGAARLDAEIYEDVERDRSATGQAFLVVLLASAAAGIGAFAIFVSKPPDGFVVETNGCHGAVRGVRIAGVVALHRVEDHRRVLDPAREGSDVVHGPRERVYAPVADAARGGFDADASAVR